MSESKTEQSETPSSSTSNELSNSHEEKSCEVALIETSNDEADRKILEELLNLDKPDDIKDGEDTLNRPTTYQKMGWFVKGGFQSVYKALNTISGIPSNVVQGVAANWKKAQNELMAKYDMMAVALKAQYDSKKKQLEVTVKRSVQKKLEVWLETQGRPALKRSIAGDPDMPKWLSEQLEDLVESVWPDIKFELKSLYEDKMYDKDDEKENAFLKEDEEAGEGTNLTKRQKFRAFFLYNLYPYDMTIWAKLKNAWYVLFKFLRMVPYISSFGFLLTLMLIDQEDEFQLINFILEFKGTQFLSVGVIGALWGGLKYIRCVNLQVIEVPKEDGRNTFLHTCDVNGPSTSAIDICGFILQIFLIWAALRKLPFSSKKGIRKPKMPICPIERSLSAQEEEAKKEEDNPSSPESTPTKPRRRGLRRRRPGTLRNRTRPRKEIPGETDSENSSSEDVSTPSSSSASRLIERTRSMPIPLADGGWKPLRPSLNPRPPSPRSAAMASELHALPPITELIRSTSQNGPVESPSSPNLVTSTSTSTYSTFTPPDSTTTVVETSTSTSTSVEPLATSISTMGEGETEGTTLAATSDTFTSSNSISSVSSLASTSPTSSPSSILPNDLILQQSTSTSSPYYHALSPLAETPEKAPNDTHSFLPPEVTKPSPPMISTLVKQIPEVTPLTPLPTLNPAATNRWLSWWKRQPQSQSCNSLSSSSLSGSSSVVSSSTSAPSSVTSTASSQVLSPTSSRLSTILSLFPYPSTNTNSDLSSDSSATSSSTIISSTTTSTLLLTSSTSTTSKSLSEAVDNLPYMNRIPHLQLPEPLLKENNEATASDLSGFLSSVPAAPPSTWLLRPKNKKENETPNEYLSDDDESDFEEEERSDWIKIERSETQGYEEDGVGNYTWTTKDLIGGWVGVGRSKLISKAKAEVLAYEETRKAAEEAEHLTRADKNRLYKMLTYDLVIFSITLGLFIISFLIRWIRVSWWQNLPLMDYFWQIQADIFWLKTLYGLLSFPFVIFILPLVAPVLLHLAETGYNRHGVCVPRKKNQRRQVPGDPTCSPQSKQTPSSPPMSNSPQTPALTSSPLSRTTSATDPTTLPHSSPVLTTSKSVPLTTP